MSHDLLVNVEGVSKKFCRRLKRSLWYGVQDTISDLLARENPAPELRREEFWAIDGISFQLRRGECVGLIGRNGAGKSTLLKMLNGLIKPDRGRIEMRGRVCALIELGAGFNPVLTGRENIYINGAVLGLSRSEIDSKIDDIIDFAEVGDFIDAPVRSYSSGMHVRLGFAVATALEPDVVLLDEVLAVGDENFQAKCYNRIGKLLARAAVIFVSHDSYQITKICDRAILLRNGQIELSGPPGEVLSVYASENPGQPKEPLNLVGDEVLDARICRVSPEVGYGGKLKISLEVNIATQTKCDQAYLNIIDDAENVHAQVILSGLYGELPPGITRFTISVGPLHLTKGRFYGNLYMFSSGGKETLIHLRNCLEFSGDGPHSRGPTYYPLSEVERSRESPNEPLDARGVALMEANRSGE
jgi:lipopolysaccharide transport system ATP-binding protein